MKELRCIICKKLLFKYEGILNSNIEIKCKCGKITTIKDTKINAK